MDRWLEAARRHGPLAVILGLAVALLVSALGGEHGLARIAGLRNELVATNEHNFQLVQAISQLRLQLQRIRSDDVALERLARRRLSLVRDGEILYRLPPGKPAAGADAAASPGQGTARD